jgi:mannose-6-phosphate isomerase-like protein (cupin superfamily)
MARPGDELVDSAGVRLVFRETASSSGGAAFALDWFVPPGGRLVALPHVHPTDVEIFEIVAGRARYRVGRHAYERSAPYTYGVPAGALHVHPANAGDTELHVRQIVRPDPPNERLVTGAERFFETTFALDQRGEVYGIGLYRDPLQSAITLHELLFPFAYLAWVPIPAQRAVLGHLAELARRRGYAAHVEPARA